MENQDQLNIEELQKKLEACEKEREEYLNGWKRAKADFINYQKDEAKRAEAIVAFSNESLIWELLAVLDSFNLSLAVLDKENENVKKGVEIIYFQLEALLKKHGLEQIQSIDMKFDPSQHEAMEEVESDKESGTVIEELTKGWKLHGKVIRPARVKVAK